MLTGVQEWRRLCGSLEPDETLTWRNEAEAQPAMACPQQAGTERASFRSTFHIPCFLLSFWLLLFGNSCEGKTFISLTKRAALITSTGGELENA